MSTVLAVIARIRAAPGKADALAKFLVEQAAAVRRLEPGCLAYRVHRSTTDPDVFVFYETYADDAAFDLHRNAPHLAEFRDRREQAGLTTGAVEVELFRPLTE